MRYRHNKTGGIYETEDVTPEIYFCTGQFYEPIVVYRNVSNGHRYARTHSDFYSEGRFTQIQEE